MGRQPCCDKLRVKKGPWTAEEDKKLVAFILGNGHCSWRAVPKLAGLLRCGKSCRLRWTNYLRPDLKRGLLTDAEEQLVIDLHSRLGNSCRGRTDNEIKNHWNTHIKKKLIRMGIDPVTHKPLGNLNNQTQTVGSSTSTPTDDEKSQGTVTNQGEVPQSCWPWDDDMCLIDTFDGLHRSLPPDLFYNRKEEPIVCYAPALVSANLGTEEELAAKKVFPHTANLLNCTTSFNAGPFGSHHSYKDVLRYKIQAKQKKAKQIVLVMKNSYWTAIMALLLYQESLLGGEFAAAMLYFSYITCRLRTGNVLFNYRYYSNKLQKTEVTEDFSCPFCLVQCASFKGLRYHLCACHDLFNFEFWVTEEYQAVNVSVKTDLSRSEALLDGVDPRLQTFFYCSTFKRLRSLKNLAQNVNHMLPHVLDLDSPDAAVEGSEDVYLQKAWA
ncbi:hypothetical protein HPP92_008682 [Vanilla planifolia]|uniref:Uncharacterized protein n=1 Tax=Vanilla planifolia TaxID=51239 RepID=A0A835RI78_VANPL|nr:hypothetical protein HPP92_008682 [Vanilla planifolia]